MKSIGLKAALVCSLLICSCATTDRPVSAPWLPAEVVMNKGAGRGKELIVKLRLEDGEVWPFVLDTGTSFTLVDKSMEPKLGKRLGAMWMKDTGGHIKTVKTYRAPKFYLGTTPLVMGRRVGICDHGGVGILGMDCLSHYCIQLDFKAAKIRFLDPSLVSTAGLGRAFPLTYRHGVPCIHGGLAGKMEAKAVIDTGCNIDGLLKANFLRREVRKTIDRPVSHESGFHPGLQFFPQWRWDGQTYTNLIIGTGVDTVGLEFLARHLVTLNFPKRMMYLERVKNGTPWRSEGALMGVMSSPNGQLTMQAIEFVGHLLRAGRLPGAARGVLESGPITPADSRFPRSRTFVLRMKGGFVNHYTVVKSSRHSSWRLQRAWKTDAQNHIVEEYRIK